MTKGAWLRHRGAEPAPAPAEWAWLRVACVALVVCYGLGTSTSAQSPNAPSYFITRHLEGDVFSAPAPRCPGECGPSSGGTASKVQGADCSCQCLSNLPIFRDDLHVCVDDIHECSLVPFVSGSSSQTVPFVFLPLKGQIIFPSAELQFPGNSSPICVVSGARFLARAGWIDMRNQTDTEPPLRLLRDKGRTFLQWLGESGLRRSMEGRLLLIQLMCKEEQTFFTPCVGLRVAGTPNSFTGVREVSFSAVNSNGAGSTEPWSGGAGAAAGWLVGAVGALLGVAYVLAALVYMRNLKRKNKHRERQIVEAATRMEEGGGLVSSHNGGGNGGRFSGRDNAGYLHSDSSSCCSDSAEETAASDSNSDHAPHSVVSVVVHGCGSASGSGSGVSDHYLLQDSSTIERLPEEDVSIVETPEAREERPDTVRAVAGPARRKLYFNPAYFEPELLVTPPPAALEFLSKIREVISIAKHKMTAKKFSPSLMQIPEEDAMAPPTLPSPSPPASSARLATSKSCTGCPGCTAAQLPPVLGPPGCNVCEDVPHSKNHSIRKWLEEVRAPKGSETDDAHSVKSEGSVYGPVVPLRPLRPNRGSFRQNEPNRRRNTPRTPAKLMLENMRAARAKQANDDYNNNKRPNKPAAPPAPIAKTVVNGLPKVEPNNRALTDDVFRLRSNSVTSDTSSKTIESVNNSKNARANNSDPHVRRNAMHSPPPLPPIGPQIGLVAQQKEVIAKKFNGGVPRKTPPCPPPPPPIAKEKPHVPKQLMDAVIKELVVQRGMEHPPPPPPVISIRSREPSPARRPVHSRESSPQGRCLRSREPSPVRLIRSREPSPAREASPTLQLNLRSREPSPVRSIRTREAPAVAITLRSREPSPAGRSLRSREPSPMSRRDLQIPSSPRSSVFEDSLERPKQPRVVENGISTPSDYGEIAPQSILRPCDLENELKKAQREAILALQQKPAMTIQKPAAPKPPQKPVDEDNEYEIIVLSPEPVVVPKKDEEGVKKGKGFNLPEFLTNSEGYSLVSEVYVNDNYSFSTSESPSPTNSSCSDGQERPDHNIRYSDKQPGHLTIQVDDSSDNRRIPEIDNFEPDTLDRKSITKLKVHCEDILSPQPDVFLDSLERSGPQIFLRTSGSFRSDQVDSRRNSNPVHEEPFALNASPSPFSRMFGSLREIYESRARCRALEGTQSLHGSTHGGSIHGGSIHGGSQYSDTDCTSVTSSKRSVRTTQSSRSNSRRQRYPSPPGSLKRSRKPPATAETNAPPRPPPIRPPKPQALYQEPPPPRPIASRDPTRPPLPPRNPKPALPPKCGSTRSGGSSKRRSHNPAHRPLPPLPPLPSRAPPSTSSRGSKRDIDAESINSSDYEAFYSMPLSNGNSSVKGQFILQSASTASSPVPRRSRSRGPDSDAGSEKAASYSGTTFLQDSHLILPLPLPGTRGRVGKDLVKHMRDKRNSDSVKKSWRKVVDRTAHPLFPFPHKPEDSGYLSTDSNESRRRLNLHKVQSQGSLSETDESLCDGASESGAESVATDSFFFGTFQGASAATPGSGSTDRRKGSRRSSVSSIVRVQ